MEPGQTHQLGDEKGEYNPEAYRQTGAENGAQTPFLGRKAADGHGNDYGIVTRQDDVADDNVDDCKEEIEVYAEPSLYSSYHAI
jgi:hypothetical protein